MYMETFERRLGIVVNKVLGEGKKPNYRVYKSNDEETGAEIFVLELRVDNIFLRLTSPEGYAPLFHRTLRMLGGIFEKKYPEGVRRRPKKIEVETETYEVE